MISLPFFTVSYWFDPIAHPFVTWGYGVLLAVMGVLVVGGIMALAWIRRHAFMKEEKRAYQRLAWISFWAGVTGYLLVFFTWQLVPYLSMRIWFIVWAIVFGALKIRPLITLRRDIPALAAEAASREAYEKWLPQPKKK